MNHPLPRPNALPDPSFLKNNVSGEASTGPRSARPAGENNSGPAKIAPLPYIPSLSQVSLAAGRGALLAYFQDSWRLSDLLFQGFKERTTLALRPEHKLRHPMIFYLGHPAVLYVNKLRVAGLLKRAVDPRMETLFETGVDEMRWDDMHEGLDDAWPTVAEVEAYRENAYHQVRRLIETHPLLEPKHLPITQESPFWALVMAFEHERIHLETSSVLMRELEIRYLAKPAGWPSYRDYDPTAAARPSAADVPDNPMVGVPAQTVTLGKPADYPTFGWDNEYGSESRAVGAFSASRQLVSNGEFYAFVKSGAYLQRECWTEEGWQWRSFRNTRKPVFWVTEGPAGLHEYRLRTIFEIIPMQWDWPAIVNFHEAKAYCKWKTTQTGASFPYRLLTEAEHHALRGTAPARYNLGLVAGAENSVTAFPANEKGFHDVFGNVWQWCEDHFHPLAGSVPHPYYDDFSVPCYDGEHQMMLGGSFISTGDEASPFARFHFRPHFFQHAGFRMVQSMGVMPARHVARPGEKLYETAEMLGKYMLMHWGSDAEIRDEAVTQSIVFPTICHLPVTCARLVLRHTKERGTALDLGCAVGRSAFELARDFAHVTGIDFSQEFIRTANLLKKDGTLGYVRKDSGDEGTSLIATVDPAIDRGRLDFKQGDACSLPETETMGNFDAVLMANVLCRLPRPAECLRRMQGSQALVKPGGILVMTTPLSWLEAYTPKSRWLKGVEDIKAILTEFTLVHQEELPFVIREHARKYEYIITQATVWQRKD